MTNAALRKLVVEADRMKVTISAQQPELFDCQFSVRQGALTVPPALVATKKGSAARPVTADAAESLQPWLYVGAAVGVYVYQVRYSS